MADFVWRPVAEVETLPDGTHNLVQVLRDQWWLHDGNMQVAFWRSSPSATPSPQCNANAAIAQRFADRTPGAKGIVLVRVAYLPHRCSDYDHSL